MCEHQNTHKTSKQMGDYSIDIEVCDDCQAWRYHGSGESDQWIMDGRPEDYIPESRWANRVGAFGVFASGLLMGAITWFHNAPEVFYVPAGIATLMGGVGVILDWNFSRK